ncbi:MAG: O-antigen ligase family protein [Candidatus Eremiobacteraeota bacterium]|nr:O-antigen ligase family protein [Candidatus Eremiobacteraeota bacterium]
MNIDSAHVVLQAVRHTPLDEFAIIVYLCAFYILTVVTYRRPLFGLAGLMLIEPFALYRDVGATTLSLPKIAIAAIAIGLFLRRPPVRAFIDRRALPILIGALAIIVTTALSYFQAQFTAPVVRETFKAIEYLMVFGLALLCYRVDPDERIIRNACFFVGLVVSVLAISQEFTTAPAGMWIAHHAVPRIAGPLEGPNQLSGYLGLLLPFMVAFGLQGRTNFFELAAIFITMCAEILTLSRSGVVATVVGIAVTLYVMRKAHTKLYALGLLFPIVIGLAAVVLVGGEISHFWSTESQFQPSGLGTRAQLWEAAYRLWREHPLLGIGAGNYELELGSVGFPGIHTHANSGYIQALVEGGIPLLLSVLALTWASIAAFVGKSRDALIVGMLGASVGMAVHESVDYLLFYPKIGVLYWLLLGVSVGCLIGRDEKAKAGAPEVCDLHRMPQPDDRPVASLGG